MRQVSEGIVLTSTRYGDNRLVVNIYTREEGRRGFLVRMPETARGKVKSSYFFPLSQLEIAFNSPKEKQELVYIGDVKVVYAYREMYSDIRKSSVACFLAEVMRGFSALYPAVRFDIYSNNAEHVKERLERGTLDLGVIIGNSDLSKYERIVLPVKERWGVLVPAKCPLSQRERVTREDLAGHRVFVSKQGVSHGVADWFGEYYDKMEIYATYNLLYNAAMLVEGEIGAALCIEGAVSLYNSPNVIFKPFYPELTARNTLIYKGQPMTRTVSKFIEFIKEHCKEA